MARVARDSGVSSTAGRCKECSEKRWLLSSGGLLAHLHEVHDFGALGVAEPHAFAKLDSVKFVLGLEHDDLRFTEVSAVLLSLSLSSQTA